jgi:hypothetical protein
MIQSLTGTACRVRRENQVTPLELKPGERKTL